MDIPKSNIREICIPQEPHGKGWINVGVIHIYLRDGEILTADYSKCCADDDTLTIPDIQEE